MKKAIVIMLAVALGVSVSAYADNMEVTMIGGEEDDFESVSLDDIKIDMEIGIDNYAIILPKEYKVVDEMFFYQRGKSEYVSEPNKSSGEMADYILLKVDITNTMTKPIDYLENCSVTAKYNDKYEYEGWGFQYNYDNESGNRANINMNGRYYDVPMDPKEFPVDPSDQFPIAPMYDGHYVFGCTLPNKVIQGKEPLSLTINLDGNELTYNVR